ncbi:MAG: NUDIX domain-containing protein [Actinophytocola sp.]|uniref:NUDIX domain-containing protein n=1 Tax=Actinophytocola sp. TaxID=1872138 RepID=UPI003C71F3A6
MRQSSHKQATARLAFSCYVFTSDARLLLTMRGQTMKTWPGVWSNSCHGHPEPGESTSDAVARALREELGLVVVPELVLPGYRGVTAGERCLVYRAVTDDPPHPDPAAVGDFEWVGWADFVYALVAGDLTMAPWCGPEVAELGALGENPARWPVADEAVPPAA